MHHACNECLAINIILDTVWMLRLQVKAMFCLSHPLEAQELTWVDKRAYSQLLQTWSDLMGKHPTWQGLMEDAAAANYEAVWRGLADRFD